MTKQALSQTSYVAGFEIKGTQGFPKGLFGWLPSACRPSATSTLHSLPNPPIRLVGGPQES